MANFNFRPGPLGGATLAAVAGTVALLAAGCVTEPRVVANPTLAGPPQQIAAADGLTNLQYSGSSPFGDYLAGLVAGKQRDLAAAADLMYRALESDPENKTLLRQAFILMAADGRHSEALRLARRVVADFPEDSAARLVLAVDGVERGELDAALASFEGLPSRGLSAILTPMVTSWVELSRTGIDGAKEIMAPLKENEGFATLFNLQMALLHDVAGEVGEAEALYRATLEPTSQSSLRLTWLAGNFFERQGKAEDARQLYASYLGAEPESTLFNEAIDRIAAGTRPQPAVPDHKAGIAEVLFNLASLLSQERAEETALIYTHLALRLNPRFNVARILLGEVLESQERLAEAAEAYRGVDPASPFSWMARLRIAEALERLGRMEEAITELEGLAEERPGRFEPLFRVGNMLRGQERFAEAVRAYDRAFARVEDPDSAHWSMHYFRGIALERSGAWARAEKDLLTALDREPEQPYVMNYLAYSWVEQRTHLDEAKKMLERAVELRPNDGYIVDSLGWVYYRLGEPERSVGHLERAVELRPQDPVINDHLGDAYWKVGRYQEARFQWRRALSLGPEAELVPTIDAKIEGGLGAVPQKI